MNQVGAVLGIFWMKKRRRLVFVYSILRRALKRSIPPDSPVPHGWWAGHDRGAGCGIEWPQDNLPVAIPQGRTLLSGTRHGREPPVVCRGGGLLLMASVTGTDMVSMSEPGLVTHVDGPSPRRSLRWEG